MKRHAFVTVLARMAQFAASTLCFPALVGAIYGERVWVFYIFTALGTLLLSFALQFAVRGAGHEQLTRRDGFLAVVSSWILMVVIGAIPFWISGSIPAFADAFFESASGYSTTGATILTNIETLPRAHLFQRSMAHWVGGMGIIVLTVAILPELAVGGMQLFAAESSGISTQKLSPRIASTARELWGIYVAMTAALVVLLLIGGMDLFDALVHAFGTLATGGFSSRNASIAAFDSVYIDTVITIFMLISGMSFALHYRLLVRRQAGPLLRSPEVQLYLVVFALFALAITASLLGSGTYGDPGRALRDATFQTASILTTTGFGTADFDRWPDFCRYLLVLLMFLGGCAGSTAGGVKVVRLIVVAKHAAIELKKLLYPTLVQPVMIRGRAIPQSTIQGILGFFLLYISTTAIATLLVLATGVDLVTGVSAVVSAMNSIGPGLGVVGPSGNYGSLPEACKWILSVCMIVGRLEIYTVFVLFTAEFWRRG
jgi:trk system potassium uptake protein TrkH